MQHACRDYRRTAGPIKAGDHGLWGIGCVLGWYVSLSVLGFSRMT